MVAVSRGKNQWHAAEMFGVRKLESLGYDPVFSCLVQYCTGVWRMDKRRDGQTHDNICRTSIASSSLK